MGIYLDLQKAFDTVNHTILLQKLAIYEIRGTVLQWFDSYLTNRKQYTVLGDNKSEVDTVSCGVPQGSVLGPMLFLIYVNDIQYYCKKLSSLKRLLRTTSATRRSKTANITKR